jgi:hypothetical protein
VTPCSQVENYDIFGGNLSVIFSVNLKLEAEISVKELEILYQTTRRQNPDSSNLEIISIPIITIIKP